jgi:uncharacterized protein YeaO (DUF488 family)
VKIYTTYFAKLKKLPSDIIPVPISNSIPGTPSDNTSYSSLYNMKYKKLVPPWYVVKDYQSDHDEMKYTQRYEELILDHLDASKVYADLERMSGGNDVALVCYEKTGGFCHRHLVAEWLKKAGYDVDEWEEK